MKTFYFNTGVRPYIHNPPVRVQTGDIVSSNGVLLVPFQCEDVPDNSIFQFCCNNIPPGSESLLKREMFNTNMVSKYAFFKVPKT